MKPASRGFHVKISRRRKRKDFMPGIIHPGLHAADQQLTMVKERGESAVVAIVGLVARLLTVSPTEVPCGSSVFLDSCHITFG